MMLLLGVAVRWMLIILSRVEGQTFRPQLSLHMGSKSPGVCMKMWLTSRFCGTWGWRMGMVFNISSPSFRCNRLSSVAEPCDPDLTFILYQSNAPCLCKLPRFSWGRFWRMSLKQAGSVAHLVKCLPHMHKALGLSSSEIRSSKSFLPMSLRPCWATRSLISKTDRQPS